MGRPTRHPQSEAVLSVEIQRVRAAALESPRRHYWQCSEGVIGRFERFAAAHGVAALADVTDGMVESFVASRLESGRQAGSAARHERRAALRLLFRLARELGLVSWDPTLDVRLESKPARPFRPLTNGEIDRCRDAALSTLESRRIAATFAFAEATAQGSELALIQPSHVNLKTRRVELAGNRRLDARVGHLTDWGCRVVLRRLDEVDGAVPIVYAGEGGAAGQVSTAHAISTVLVRAGLAGDHAVRPASVAAWAGRSCYERTGDLATTAQLLGVRSLDTAARLIGLEWRRSQ